MKTMETSLSRLQKQNNLLNEKLIVYKDEINVLKEQNYNLKRRINYLEDNMEKRIQEAVEKALSKFESDEITRLNNENISLKERIFKLEQRLNISSDTSSLPPSQDPIWHKDTKVYDSRSQKETTKTIGGQKGHVKHKLKKFEEEEITDTKEYKLDSCNNCGSQDLSFIGIEEHDERDFEVVIKKIRHKFYKYKCNKCDEIVMSKVPINLVAENQYGSNVQALGLALVDFGDVSFKRTRDLINGLTDGEIVPSEGYLAKLPKRASKKLKNFVFDCEEDLTKSKVLQHDDGVIKIGKTTDDKDKELKKLIEKSNEELTEEDIKKLNEEIKKNFKGIIRAYTNGKIKLYKAHTNKSSDTYKEDNILTRLSAEQTVVHDNMKYNYNDLFKFKNAECNIHPIRKGRGIKANTNHQWPDKIAELLEGYNKKRDELIEAKINSFTSDELDTLNKEYDKIIDEGFKECNQFIHKNIYNDEENLLEFFRKYKHAVLEWTVNFSVPFTNNLCESMIRLVKSKMKISYSFKNIESARYYADIITYTETCFSFGINRYQAIKRLFEDNPYTLQELYKIEKAQTSDKENT